MEAWQRIIPLQNKTVFYHFMHEILRQLEILPELNPDHIFMTAGTLTLKLNQRQFGTTFCPELPLFGFFKIVSYISLQK
ncbi:hypothetical protein ACX93W_07295 [Paenibacillus sp. CAU 1782]